MLYNRGYTLSFVMLAFLFLGGVGLVAANPPVSNLAVSSARISPGSFLADTSAPLASPTPAQCPEWSVVFSPSPGSTTNHLFDISGVSSDDVWAVGSYADNGLVRGLIEHWNGTQWSVTPDPIPGNVNILIGVEAISANDVWAVGYYTPPGGPWLTLVEHWDGTEWRVVPSPNSGPHSNVLRAVSATGPNDVWAVGAQWNDSGAPDTLIMHWDGVQWSVVPSPNPSLNNELRAVSALSASDVWAVGFYQTPPGRTLTMHWDGVQWSFVPSPSIGPLQNRLSGVTAIAPNNVWAVGQYVNTTTNRGESLIIRWDGSQWSVVPSPNLGQGANVLLDVDALSANDVWAVGYYSIPEVSQETLVLHWDGGQWNAVPSPSPAAYLNLLYGVVAISSTDVWTAGYALDCLSGGCPWQTLIERYSDTCGLQSPTPTGTAALTQTATATSTSTAVGGTSTPTACPFTFSDVPEGSTFYTFVRCLACKGVVSGYADGTFRPGYDVTRAQLSKIVANSAGFEEPPTTWTFQDVEPGSPFYPFVERLSQRGIIGGYECGAANEPCVQPENRPYFRPQNNATRAQISKIVSNAAQIIDPPGEQIFEDMPPGNAFYDWIQRLASRGIMGGYECGGPSEPCGPQRKPYFRPQNNATRGQTSKIVSNTFFPGCNPSLVP